MKRSSSRCRRFHPQFASGALLALVILLCGSRPAPAAADSQQPLPVASESTGESTQGFYLGIGLGGSSLPTVDRGATALDIENDGGAFAIRGGYGFNPVFALELRILGAAHDTSDRLIDATFGALELFAVYRWRPEHAFRPYVRAGLGAYGIVLDDGTAPTTVTGGGIPFGGGFEYFLGRHVSLGFDVTHRVIDYDKITVDTGSTTGAFAVDRDGAQTSSALTVGVYF